jgi:DNA-directed RNA polymerase specialized sigma24 family protein
MDKLDRRFLAIQQHHEFRSIVGALARRIRRAEPGTEPMNYVVAAIATRKNLEVIVEAGERGLWAVVNRVVRRKVFTRLAKDCPLVSIHRDGEPRRVPRYVVSEAEPTTFLAIETSVEQQQLLKLAYVDVIKRLSEFAILHPDDAKVLIALCLWEVPREEVARAFEVNDGALRARLFKARERFERFLSDRGYAAAGKRSRRCKPAQ